MNAGLVDSHCHLDFPEFSGRVPELLAAMAENGVVGALIAGVSLDRMPAILKLAESHPGLFAAVGVHPDNDAGAHLGEGDLLAYVSHPKIVAIGETGLDYYRIEGDLEWQRERFRTHIRVALKTSKPLIIHTRESASDTLKIVTETGEGRARGVFHCFTETWDVAQAALALGFYISISGIVTFKKADQVRHVAERVPLDRLLIETDAPYLAPVPHRGKLNHPALVRHVAEEVAKVRGIPFADVAAATRRNFESLFGVSEYA